MSASADELLAVLKLRFDAYRESVVPEDEQRLRRIEAELHDLRERRNAMPSWASRFFLVLFLTSLASTLLAHCILGLFNG